MQVVSSALLSALRSDTKSLVTLVEFYQPDAVPDATLGWNPASSDCVLALAAVSGITFCGVAYQRLIAKGGIGTINRTIKKELSGFSLTLDNSTRAIIDYQNSLNGGYGFEGLICIVRRIDRNSSTVLADSTVRFTGRCDSPDEFDKSSETAKINVKQILNAVEIPMPRRKFTATDADGRPQSDPEFEGFPFTPRGGTINYNEKVQAGGFLGAVFQRKKTVTRTLNYSSHNALQEETCVPVVCGRQQINLLNFGYIDRGTYIEGLGFWCDGHENGIADVRNIRSITDGFPLSSILTYYGLKGGDGTGGTQAKDNPVWVAQGWYSRTAVTRFVAQGTTIQQDDSAPAIAGLVFGQKMLVPASDGTFTVIDFTDSAVCHARWLLASAYFFNLPGAWFDDVENKKSYDYGNHVLVDQANTDTVILNATQAGIAGVDYKIYKSTAAITPAYYKTFYGAEIIINAAAIEAPYNYYTNPPYNSDDPTGIAAPALPATQLRRRFTCNFVLLEDSKAIDILYDIIFASSNLYLIQNAKGQFAIKNKRPEDFTFMRTSSAAGATTLDVQNVNSFLSYTGKILIGANTSVSEVRSVTGASYSSAGNSVAISASGGMSASGSTLSGASGSTPASATLTVTAATGTKTYSISGFSLSYSPAASDTTSTVAGFIASQINSHELLNKTVKAVWNNNTTVTVQSRLGTLTLDSALENAHNPAIADPSSAIGVTVTSGGTLAAGNYQLSITYLTLEGETNPSPITAVTVGSANSRISVPAITLPSRVLAIRYYFSAETNGVRRKLLLQSNGAAFYINSMPRLTERMEPLYNTTSEEIHKVAFVFTDKANTKTGLVKSNVLKGTFKFPLGSKSQNYNQVELSYKDSAADYKSAKLLINDGAKQAKSKKKTTLKIDGSGIDNEHQARRIGNSNLAEAADGGKFYALTSDNEAQLLEEGDIICCTDESGRLVNEPARVEAISDDDNNGYPTVSITARKYRRYYYDDQVQERLVPLPIVQNTAINVEQNAPEVYQQAAATNTIVYLGIRAFSTDAAFRQIQVSHDSTFATSTDITAFTQTAVSEVGQILPGYFNVTRTLLLNNVALTSTETIYVRVRHSSNGNQYGAWSNILTQIYPTSGGSGGSTGSPPTGLSGTFSGTTISGGWTNNGGTGSNVVRYSLNGGAWTTVGTYSASTSTFTFTPTVNGSYVFDVTNTAVTGSATSGAITVSGLGGTGSPPSGLDYVTQTDGFDFTDVTFSWVNNGGTGLNTIEVKRGSGSFVNYGTASASATSKIITLSVSGTAYYTVRVSNASVTGYATWAGYITVP